MEKFEEGDKVRMRQSCSGAYIGEIYTLRHNENGLVTTNEKGHYLCSCPEYWEIVEKKQTKNGNFINKGKKFSFKQT